MKVFMAILFSLWGAYAFADIGRVTCLPAPNCYEVENPATGCQINSGQWCDITATNHTTGQDECRRVTNNELQAAFIPAKIGTDNWYAFVVTPLLVAIEKSGAGCSVGTTHCETAAVGWTAGGNNCSGNAPGPRNFNTTEPVSDSSQPTTGSATFVCFNGGWQVQAGSTCVSSCSATTQNWGSGCSGNLAAVADGSTSTTSSSGTHTGSATFLCTNGVWSEQSGSTCYSSCNGTTLSWSSCSGPVNSAGHGDVATVTNSAANFTGTASYQCSNGTWSGPSSSNCTATTVCEVGSNLNGAGGPTPTPSCECNNANEAWCANTLTCLPVSVPGCPAGTSGTPNGGSACTLPWGGSLPSGCTKKAFIRSSSNNCSAGVSPRCSICDDGSQMRTCSNGTLSGSASYNKQSCSNFCDSGMSCI